MDYFILVIAGVLGGTVAGLLGVGGGVVYILILPSFLRNYGICDEEMVSFVVSNSIFSVLFVSISGNIKSIIAKTFDYKKVFLIGVSGAISSILSMEFIVRSAWYSKMEFNIAVSLLLSIMFVRLFNKIDSKPKVNHVFFYVLTGVIAGLASALSGLGGGVIIVPLLLYFYGNSVKEAKTISLGVIGIMAFSLTMKNIFSDIDCVELDYTSGYIVFPIASLLSLGVVLGTPLGIKISNIISEKWLRYLFALMLLIVIVKKFFEIATELKWL